MDIGTTSNVRYPPVVDQLGDLTKCVICKENFTDPRSLPCLHTFCMECIQTWINEGRETSDDDATSTCPTCRQVFTAPSNIDGKCQLPKNFMVANILLIRTQLSIRIDENSSELNGIEGQTERNTAAAAAAVRYNDDACCCQAVDKRMLSYCADCKYIFCLLCNSLLHSAHKCIGIKEASNELQQLLTADAKLLDGEINAYEHIATLLTHRKLDLTEKITAIETTINNRAMLLVGSASCELTDQLAEVKRDSLQKINHLMGEVVEQKVFADSLRQAILDLERLGSATDVINHHAVLHNRVSNVCKASDLLRRVNDLNKEEMTLNASENDCRTPKLVETNPKISTKGKGTYLTSDLLLFVESLSSIF